MKRLRAHALLAAAALTAGCTSNVPEQSHAQVAMIPYDAPRDQCTARGGIFHPEGIALARAPICVTPYADGGTRCTDSSQCIGRCLVDLAPRNWNDPLPRRGAPAVGSCEPGNATGGTCTAEVRRGGIASPVVCAD